MVQAVLEGWSFLELINTVEIPKRNVKLRSKYIETEGDVFRVVPFSEVRSFNHIKVKENTKASLKYRYYMSNYRNYELIQLFRNHFKIDDEIINKSSTLHFGASFEVDETGKYIEETLMIPHLQLVIDDLQRKNKVDYESFIERYEEKKNNFEEKLRILSQSGMTEDTIEEIEKALNTLFMPIETTNKIEPYVECLIVLPTKDSSTPLFNSFFIDDLQEILRKGSNKTLTSFIKGQDMEVNIDENREAIEKVLHIDNLPEGRWPSPINHRLSLMQQVAVNLILQRKSPISSVNGPPGTGKTTLLQDVFAQLMVERAMEMAKLEDPKEGFRKASKQEIDFGTGKTYQYNMHELVDNIARYSILVTSSNNGAVENISKELPLLDEIARDGSPPSEKERKEELKKTGVDPMMFYEYDQAFVKEIEKLNYFPNFAERLLDGDRAWGLFSVALGKAKNMTNANKALGGEPDFLSELNHLSGSLSWKEVVKEFWDLIEDVKLEKKAIKDYIARTKKIHQLEESFQQLVNDLALYKKKEEESKAEINQLEEEELLLEKRLDNLPVPSFFEKIIRMFTGKKNEEEIEIRSARDKVLKALAKLKSNYHEYVEKIEKLSATKLKMKTEIEVLKEKNEKYEKEDIQLSTDEFWAEDFYEERQESVLFQSHSLNFKRSMLFLKAMQVHKAFLIENRESLKTPLTMFKELKSINVNIAENKENIKRMWKILHLIFPVMSTTFASIGSMYRGMDEELIDYLFVDEAGQASPQLAAGAMWRSKHATIVGDPIQIEPVVTTDETILSDIRKHFKLSENHIGESASVQTMADLANPFGTYKGSGDNQERIGIPLWVHRRCLNPMFAISNEIAYDNKMVLANNKTGYSAWYDVSGPAKEAQFVEEQAKFLVDKLDEAFEEAKEGELPSIFVITPFTAVRNGLISTINRSLGKKHPEIKKWANSSIGTVHTFQGKEADTVYFVTGTDEATDGAANWSCMKPNILNVAATRAKKNFYVIGDLERFKGKQYYDTIVKKFSEYKKLEEESEQ